MLVIVNIQSISDIITNSSSEVFPARAKWYTEDSLKDLITAILVAGGSDYNCNDLFDIRVVDGAVLVDAKIDTPEVYKAAERLTYLEELFEACEN